MTLQRGTVPIFVVNENGAVFLARGKYERGMYHLYITVLLL